MSSVDEKIVFGADEKAKEKASSRGAAASKPGVVSVSDNSKNDTRSSSSHNNRDSKKSRSSNRRKRKDKRSSRRADSNSNSNKSSRSPSGRSKNSRSNEKSSRSTSAKDAFEIAEEKDAKAKAKISRGSSKATSPGVQRIENSAAPKTGDKGFVADPLFQENQRKVSTPVVHNSAAGIVLDENGVPTSNGTPKGMDQVATGVAAVESAPDDDKPENQRKGNNKLFILLAVIFLFLVGGGVAAFVALKGGDDEEVSQATALPSVAPLTPLNTAPTISPTMEVIYDAPSESDCDIIARNETTIAGQQDDETVNTVQLTFEVTLSADVAMSNDVVTEMAMAIQKWIVPSLVGCGSRTRRALSAVGTTGIRGSIENRQLESDQWRYAISNAFVQGELNPNQSCAKEDDSNCNIVEMELHLFLKAQMQFLSSRVEREFENNTTLVDLLQLDDSFAEVKLASLSMVELSDAPTGSPSKSPATPLDQSPTVPPASGSTPLPTVTTTTDQSPTMQPVLGYTSPPTVSPEAGFTPLPTAVSTNSPFADPTSSPTFSPASNPTDTPTVTLTEAPNTEPTEPPVPVPTEAPTEDTADENDEPGEEEQSPAPSLEPNPATTPAPTKSPTKTPTNAPTKFPTVAPSKTPTKAPTKTPTKAPTENPTKAPTKPPTIAPTIVPTTNAPSKGPTRRPTLIGAVPGLGNGIPNIGGGRLP
ncbi:MAG: hypothetical protein SGBAC_007738 [Bacillariaceae sp.]